MATRQNEATATQTEAAARQNEPDARHREEDLRHREVNPRLSIEDFRRWEAYYRITAVRRWEAEARNASTNIPNRSRVLENMQNQFSRLRLNSVGDEPYSDKENN